MAITPPKALVPAAVLVWSGLAVAGLSVSQQRAGARQGEPVLADPAHPFEARWEDAVPEDQPLLKKQDRLPLPVAVADVVDIARANQITERMPPAPNAPVSVPPVILVQDEDPPSLRYGEAGKPASRHRRQHDAQHNVCTRHGMHKIAVRGGKSWRCGR